MVTIVQCKEELRQALLGAGIDEQEAKREVEMIVQHVTGWRLAEQVLQEKTELSLLQLSELERIKSERLRRVPLQYCLGVASFMGMDFTVRSGVLIPRADTECLVETAIKLLQGTNRPLIADVGTGSGAIAVSLLKFVSDAIVYAIDISPTAIEVTAENARLQGVGERLFLSQGDWRQFAPASPLHAVVSNPPYVPRRLQAELQPEVAVFEPEEALFGPDDDGLGFFRSLAEHAGQILAQDGFIACELGAGQAEAVRAIFENGRWKKISTHIDLGGIPRVLSAFRAI